MADGRSAEEAAATDLCDDSRVPRERHKKHMIEHRSMPSGISCSSSESPSSSSSSSLIHTDRRQIDPIGCTSKSKSQSVISVDGNDHDNKISVSNNKLPSDGCDRNNDCKVMPDNNNDLNESKSVGMMTRKRQSSIILKNACYTNNKYRSMQPTIVVSSLQSPVVSSVTVTTTVSTITINTTSSPSSNCGDKLITNNNIKRSVEFGANNNNNNNIINKSNNMDINSCVSSDSGGNSDADLRSTVVDAAAAAVAVSAIPESMKDLHQHKQQSGDVARLGSPFKGQIRMAEDTLVGPCGKKRCADRYDSSESSDSGVVVSCGECSSSGTSDITEPGSPCSTSSDEGVAISGKAPSPLPILPKLAPIIPPVHNGTRPQWPWTPPLAATACSTYKHINGEPEVGTLPKAGAADPTVRITKTSSINTNNNSSKTQTQNHHHHQETQGKITEYFKTQIKPQQSKIKKTGAEMPVLVAKSPCEFRRPLTVQRNKVGLAKYLSPTTPNGKSINDWDVRTMTVSSPPANKLPIVTVTKLDKMLVAKALPGLPISSDVLSSISGCKISSLRFASETNLKVNGPSSPSTGESLNINFDNNTKPTVNENNNLTSSTTNHITRTQLSNSQDHPLTRLTSSLLETRERKELVAPSPRRELDDEEEEEEEDSSRSSESKPSSSPILSKPTTIRFPARAPAKSRARVPDSGICQWDKCDFSYECCSFLLEHLQTVHINTQTGGDNFVCQWQGCKVQGRTSCSRRWLERHVLSHGGNKPFRCIVDGCGSRFSSQTTLERHVNSHFNQPETSNKNTNKNCENGGKLVRRNGKKLRYRRQPWSARIFDYFDTGVMEGLQYRLLESAKSRTLGNLVDTPGNSMALTSQVIGKRIEKDGKTKVLLRWHPHDIAPDEWVLESEVQNIKHIDIRKAANTAGDELNVVLYSALNGGKPPLVRTKQRRKPVKNS